MRRRLLSVKKVRHILGICITYVGDYKSHLIPRNCSSKMSEFYTKKQGSRPFYIRPFVALLMFLIISMVRVIFEYCESRKLGAVAPL